MMSSSSDSAIFVLARVMPRTKMGGDKNANSPATTTSEIQLNTTRTTMRRKGGKKRLTKAGKELSWTTRLTKRNNGTANPPHLKHQCLDNTCEQDDDSSSGDTEDFDDTLLMKADIPKIVEAVINQFPRECDGSQEDYQNNLHFGKFLY